jgi:hypothetical protein
MPPYSNALPPSSIGPGDSAQVWTVADGTWAVNIKTQRVALIQRPSGGPTKLSVRVTFLSNPGAQSFQLQTADNDVDGEYINEGAAINVNTAAFVSRAEFPNIVAKFARLTVVTITNTTTAVAELTA